MSNPNLTQARVKELFDYREDGKLIWKKQIGSRAMVGTVAGYLGKNGYRQLRLAKKLYRGHRIVWLWHYGYLPENGVDHINRERDDNRIENLREVSMSCNIRNTGNFSHNTSGVKGVRLYRSGEKWIAQVKVSGKSIHLGTHLDFFEAVCHRLAGEQALGWPGCDSSSPAYQYVQAHIGNAA